MHTEVHDGYQRRRDETENRIADETSEDKQGCVEPAETWSRVYDDGSGLVRSDVAVLGEVFIEIGQLYAAAIGEGVDKDAVLYERFGGCLLIWSR